MDFLLFFLLPPPQNLYEDHDPGWPLPAGGLTG